MMSLSMERRYFLQCQLALRYIYERRACKAHECSGVASKLTYPRCSPWQDHSLPCSQITNRPFHYLITHALARMDAGINILE